MSVSAIILHSSFHLFHFSWYSFAYEICTNLNKNNRNSVQSVDWVDVRKFVWCCKQKKKKNEPLRLFIHSNMVKAHSVRGSYHLIMLRELMRRKIVKKKIVYRFIDSNTRRNTWWNKDMAEIIIISNSDKKVFSGYSDEIFELIALTKILFWRQAIRLSL